MLQCVVYLRFFHEHYQFSGPLLVECATHQMYERERGGKREREETIRYKN